MAISKREIKHIAYLARLRLKEAEIKHYQKELSEILDFVHQLTELNDKERNLPQKAVITNKFRCDEKKKKVPCKRKNLLHQEFLEKNYLKIPLIFKK